MLRLLLILLLLNAAIAIRFGLGILAVILIQILLLVRMHVVHGPGHELLGRRRKQCPGLAHHLQSLIGIEDGTSWGQSHGNARACQRESGNLLFLFSFPISACFFQMFSSLCVVSCSVAVWCVASSSSSCFGWSSSSSLPLWSSFAFCYLPIFRLLSSHTSWFFSQLRRSFVALSLCARVCTASARSFALSLSLSVLLAASASSSLTSEQARN